MATTPREPRRAIALGDTALSLVADATEAVPIVEGFSVSVNGLVVSGQPTYEACELMGTTLRTAERGIQFAIGDFLNYIDEHLGERASQIVDYSEGWSKKTCDVYSWIAKRISPERRRMDRLGIKHHLLVAGMSADKQREWLDRAADSDEDPWTVKRLQQEIKANGDLVVTGWWVLVNANDESDQRALMATLESQGRTCKATMRRRSAAAVNETESIPEASDASDS